MTITDFQIGDICVHAIDGKLFVIDGFQLNNQKYPILFKSMTGAKGKYKGSPEDFLGKVGEIDILEWYRLREQSNRSITKPSGHVDYNPWDFKIGQKITIIGKGGRKEEVTFAGYSPRRPKYPISYVTSEGKRMKCSPEILKIS
jgi:hypothetical protein